MDCYENETDQLEKQFGDKTLGEMEQEMGINCYNHTGIGFGYLVRGKLPETREEAMKIFDSSKVDELLKV